MGFFRCLILIAMLFQIFHMFVWADTPTETETETSTATPTETETETPTYTHTPTATETSTVTPTATETETHTPTYTHTPTATETSTVTPTATLQDSPTITETATITPTPSISPTLTPSVTASPSPTEGFVNAVFDEVHLERKVFTPGGVVFDRLRIFFKSRAQAEDIRVKIFNLKNHLVRELVVQNLGDQYLSEWDGRDTAGRIRQGIYIYQIEIEGKAFNGTCVLAQ
jgi:hypothetical protein